MARHIIEIETKTFVRFWLVLIGFALVIAFIYKAAGALALVGVSALLAIAIRPLALRVERIIGKSTHTKSKLSSILAYVIVLLAISAIVVAVGPVVLSELTKFVSSLPSMVGGIDSEALDSFGRAFGFENLAGELIASVESISKSLLSSLGSSVVSGIGTISGILGKAVIVLVMTIFFLLEGPEMMNNLWAKFGAKKPKKSATTAVAKAEKVAKPAKLENSASSDSPEAPTLVSEARRVVSKMAWVVSTYVDKKVLVALIDGCVTMTSIFILSLIFHVEAHLAIPLGMITCIFCLIPMFGQVIGGVLVVAILLISNPLMALIWGLFYLIYAVIESNVFEPKIQGSALNLRPVVVLIAITIGTYVLGLFGTIIAIPIAGCIKVLIDELPNLRRASRQQN